MFEQHSKFGIGHLLHRKTTLWLLLTFLFAGIVSFGIVELYNYATNMWTIEAIVADMNEAAGKALPWGTFLALAFALLIFLTEYYPINEKFLNPKVHIPAWMWFVSAIAFFVDWALAYVYLHERGAGGILFQDLGIDGVNVIRGFMALVMIVMEVLFVLILSQFVRVWNELFPRKPIEGEQPEQTFEEPSGGGGESEWAPYLNDNKKPSLLSGLKDKFSGLPGLDKLFGGKSEEKPWSGAESDWADKPGLVHQDGTRDPRRYVLREEDIGPRIGDEQHGQGGSDDLAKMLGLKI